MSRRDGPEQPTDAARLGAAIKCAMYTPSPGPAWTLRPCERIRRPTVWRAAARVAHLTGWMAYEAGLRSFGQRYYVGALRSARTAGDDAFGFFILAKMGVHVSEAGRTTERVDLISMSRSVPPAPTARPSTLPTARTST